MSLVKKSCCLFRKSKCPPEKILFHSKQIHQKSLPLLAKNADRLLEETKSEDIVTEKVSKSQRNIFGATILPQNLSYENSKKLTENQVRLQDIPIVNENVVAESVLEHKLKGNWANLPKEEAQQPEMQEDFGVVVIETNLLKQQKDLKKAELLWFDSYEEIPGPKLLRNVLSLLKTSARHLTILSLFRFLKSYASSAYKNYGPIVKLPEILGNKVVLISRPEHIFAVFEQDHRHPFNSTLDSIQRSRLSRRSNAERTKYHLSEREWESLRQSVKSCSMKGPEKYFENIEKASCKFLSKIKFMKNGQNEVPDDFLYEINKWSLECLCCVVFDKSFGFLDSESPSWPTKTSQLLYSLTVATRDLCHLESGFQLWRFINTTSLSSLSSACDILESNISEYVAQVQLDLVRKRESPDDKNFQNLSLVEGLLLQSNLPPDDIVSTLLDTLLIGTNTVSVALGFMLYHLSQNPRVQEKLWKEVKEALPEKYTRLEYDQIKSLKYLHACLKESLRLKMPLPVLARVLSKNILLNNYQIPKGTFVLMTPQIEGMKEGNFYDPKEFIPERWLSEDATDLFTALPMGNYCLNRFERRMAEASICACVSKILRNFSIEYFYEDIEATNTVISFPNRPLKFTFLERKN